MSKKKITHLIWFPISSIVLSSGGRTPSENRPTQLEVSADINVRSGKCSMTITPGGPHWDLAEVSFAFDPESEVDEVVDGILSSINKPVVNFDDYITDYRLPFAFLMNTELEKNRRNFSYELKRGLSRNFVSVKVDMI